MSLQEWLAAREDRCPHGFAASQHPRYCSCTSKSESAEFAIFVAALHTAAAMHPDGLISQTKVRPLIQRIPPKHRGLLYRKARAAGLIEEVGKEPSTDEAGGNTDKDQKVWKLRNTA